MRGSAFIAFFGIAAAISGSLVGCGDDDGDNDGDDDAKPAEVTKSKEGESCVRTDDCDDGLACFGNVCLTDPAGTGGSTGTGGSSGTGGKGGSTTTTLGGEGESCTRRADCAPPLGCFNQRCASDGSGEGGGGNVPTQGQRGETCVLSSDCELGLICLPGGALSSLGVCSIGDSTTDPTGKSCQGDECVTADDCCELPVNLHASLGVTSCAELADALGATACNSSTPTALQPLCMAQAAYCECDDADSIWSCTSGSCSYIGECTASGMVPGGCPTSSRTGKGLYATCDTADTNLCQPAVVDPPCVRDADCDGLNVSDDLATVPDTCEGGECTCFSNQCLRACDEDFDCAIGFECDMGDSVCVPAQSCTSNERCQAVLRNVRAECVNNVCTTPCETDLDCNTSLTTTFTAVCDATGMCQPIGCSTDNECPAGANGTRTLCTDVRANAGGGAQSAITD